MSETAPTLKWHRIAVCNVVDARARRGRLCSAFELVLEFERRTGTKYENQWRSLLSAAIVQQRPLLAHFCFTEYRHRFDDDEQSWSLMLLLASAYRARGDHYSAKKLKQEMLRPGREPWD